jgi:uncharacterized protein (TIGR03790 family)
MRISACVHVCVLIAVCAAARPCRALTAGDVLVVANARLPASREVAQAYCTAHTIPSNRVILVDVENRSDMTYGSYRTAVEEPVLAAVKATDAKCIVLCHGIPWRIIDGDKTTPPHPATSTWASVDSELATRGGSGTRGMHASPNPYFASSEPFDRRDMLLVGRLDGANARDALALVVRAEAAEALPATYALLDKQPVVNGSSNGLVQAYNKAMDRTAAWLQSQGIRVYLEGSQELARLSDDVPPLSLYWGWYAGPNGDYTSNTYGGLRWGFGAVGVHVCSFGAAGMRRRESAVPALVADGVTATIGSVHEPLVQGWTLPDIFCINYFRQDGSGLTFIESAYAATRYLSWQQVFVGDPLLRYQEPD